MTYYERDLPHWHPSGTSVFLTWRLYGSLPVMVSEPGCAPPLDDAPDREFRRIDSVLDRAIHGPAWLLQPGVAECVARAIERGASELRQYRLHAFVIMANHVHLLLTPLCPLARITQGLKGASARECNKHLGRTGNRFWQDESFDHWIRTTGEFNRIRAYIEQNPVTVGLVKTPSEWLWSSAKRRAALT